MGPSLPLLVLLGASLVNAQSPSPSPTKVSNVVDPIFKCTAEEFTACDTNFKICSQYKDALTSIDVMCTCYLTSYMCYADCGKFPPSWAASCSGTCTASSCSPPLFVPGQVSAASAPVVASASVAALLIAALALLLPAVKLNEDVANR